MFARGAAEQVTDPKLMKAPLARPGAVIKVLRGDQAAQIKALGKTTKPKGKRSQGGSRIKSGMTEEDARTPSPRPSPEGKARKRAARPSRAAVDKAERALAQAEARRDKAMETLRDAERALAAKRREVEAKLREERRALEARVDEAREDYARAMEEWAAD